MKVARRKPVRKRKPGPITLKKAVDILDETFDRTKPDDRKYFWSLLSMLRGPDDASDFHKRAATIPVRRAMFRQSRQKLDNEVMTVGPDVIDLAILRDHPGCIDAQHHYRIHADSAHTAMTVLQQQRKKVRR